MLADGAQEPAGERAGAGAGLDDAGAGEDVGHRDDLRGVLGVDDGGAARHPQRVVGQQRPEGQVVGAAGGAEHGALGAADDLVVRDRALVAVVELARLRG